MRNRDVLIYRDRPSRSSRMLARALGCRVTPSTPSARLRDTTRVVNWGCTEFYEGAHASAVLNDPGACLAGVDKLRYASILQEAGVRSPRLLTFSEAVDRLESGKRVVARTLTRASGGRGTYIYGPDDTIPEGEGPDGRKWKMFSAYVPKRSEYRIHVSRNVGIFDIQHKRRARGFDERDNEIRTHANGWVFAREDIVYPKVDVLHQAWAALQCTDLHFGAVDVIWNERTEKAFVLEINTAPGLEGSTLEHYADMIEQELRSL